MDEAFAVGKAKGVSLDPAYLDDRMNFLVNKVEPGMKASMAHDLERGNRLELDWLAGKVRALGREFGIPTPASDTVYTVLKLHQHRPSPVHGLRSLVAGAGSCINPRKARDHPIRDWGPPCGMHLCVTVSLALCLLWLSSPSLATSMKSTAPERMLSRTDSKKMRACDERAMRENVAYGAARRLREEVHDGNEIGLARGQGAFLAACNGRSTDHDLISTGILRRIKCAIGSGNDFLRGSIDALLQ